MYSSKVYTLLRYVIQFILTDLTLTLKLYYTIQFENSIKLTYPLKQLLDKIRKGNPAVTDQHITSSDRG